jgi:hypothetical protein
MFGRFFQGPLHETGEFVRYVGPHHVEGRRRVPRQREKRGGRVLGLERQSTGEHFVRHHPNRPDIRPRVDLCPLRLFRRHVGDRAHHGAGVRHLRRGGRRI